jgi:hypothetical protein
MRALAGCTQFRPIFAIALSLLILAPTGCLTSRHRPVTEADPTWVTVRIPPADAQVLLMRYGRPLPSGVASRVLRGTSEVVGAVVVVAAVVATVGVVFFAIAQHSGPNSDPVGATGTVVGGAAQVNATHSQPAGASGSDLGLNAVLVCRDADSGDLIGRQPLSRGGVPLPLYDGQRVRLALELDDGVNLVEVPLTVLAPAPRQRVEITVNRGPDPAPPPTR